MRYLGGKSRIAKQLVNFMSLEREPEMAWVEPFCGSCKVLSLVNGPIIANDFDQDLIELFKALQKGYDPPSKVTKEEYLEIRANKEDYPAELKGFVKHAVTFAGIKWGPYAKDKKQTNYAEVSRRSVLKLAKLIKDVEFHSGSYEELLIPKRSLIYCDPPYLNTAKDKYNVQFDHEKFYAWCRKKAAEGHLVFVSEYQAPDDFICVWEKDVHVSVGQIHTDMRSKKEKLFRVHKKQEFKLITY